MLIRHHVEITRQALAADFSPRALEVVIRANSAQDSLRYQFGHDHFHFDNNQFAAGYAYMEEQRALVRSSFERYDSYSAWEAFGRMIHAAQDFYAHSDYIPRWLSRFDGGTPPAPEEMDPVSPDLIQHPDLRSGKLYYPLEVFAFIPPFRKFVLPFLPADSHAHMNHDGHENSPQFDYVFHAAVKRTRLEFEKTVSILSPDALSHFVDM